jgi:predicted ferric reductase
MSRIQENYIKQLVFVLIVVLSIAPIFLFWSIPVLSADVAISDMIQLYFGAFASIIGLLGAMILFWQYVLGLRFWSKFFTTDFIWLNNVHKNAGIWGFIFIALHPMSALVSYGADWFQLILPNEWTNYDIFVAYGKIALTILGTIWITSAAFRRKIPFRWWKRIHFISYLIFPLVYIHGLNVGTVLISTNLRYYWYFLGAVFPIIAITGILHHFGVFKRKATITKKEALTDEVNRFTVKLEKPLSLSPGQFIYIQLQRGGESHPFTVSHILSDDSFMISPKKEGKFTQSLDAISPPTQVFIDGPYGIFTAPAFENDAPVVFLAGGIGITPFIQPMKDLKQERTLFYSARTYDSMAFKDELLDICAATTRAKKSKAKVIFAITNESVAKEHCEEGRITADMLKKHLSMPLVEHQFYICGPKPFIKAMKDLLKAEGVTQHQFQTEEFSI